MQSQHAKTEDQGVQITKKILIFFLIKDNYANVLFDFLTSEKEILFNFDNQSFF